MTASLPAEIQAVFDRFVTTEYTTVDARGQPIVWPVTPYYEPGGPTIEVTTGVGYPKKALDAKRNPKVSLLFSDPTGSEIESGIRVLVQGTAEVDDADLRANAERYMRESKEKLPGAAEMMPPKPVQRLLGWYFERLYVKVRPERVVVWPDGDPTREPEVHSSHMEEVRSGHTEEPVEEQAPAAGGPEAWDERMNELGERYPEAVISWVGPDGFPLSVRLPVEVDRGAHRVHLGAVPAGVPVAAGRACLTAHSHAPDFTWQENFQVRGDLERSERGWSLVPHKLVGGFELPDEGRLASLRRNFGKSIGFARTARRIHKRRRSGS